MCDSRLCNDSRARCAATIFLRSPFSVLCSLFSSPRLCLLALARPRPRPFPPSSLALALIVRHHHRLRHRRRLITSTRQRSTPIHQHLRFSRSSSARSRIFGIAAFLPLPPSLVTWGTSPNSARRHRSALQLYLELFEQPFLGTWPKGAPIVMRLLLMESRIAYGQGQRVYAGGDREGHRTVMQNGACVPSLGMFPR